MVQWYNGREWVNLEAPVSHQAPKQEENKCCRQSGLHFPFFVCSGSNRDNILAYASLFAVKTSKIAQNFLTISFLPLQIGSLEKALLVNDLNT